MEGKRLYTLRYKHSRRGIQSGFIEVPLLGHQPTERELAEEIGRRWCNQNPDRRFLGVEPAVVADEMLLDAEERPAVSVRVGR